MAEWKQVGMCMYTPEAGPRPEIAPPPSLVIFRRPTSPSIISATPLQPGTGVRIAQVPSVNASSSERGGAFHIELSWSSGSVAFTVTSMAQASGVLEEIRRLSKAASDASSAGESLDYTWTAVYQRGNHPDSEPISSRYAELPSLYGTKQWLPQGE